MTIHVTITLYDGESAVTSTKEITQDIIDMGLLSAVTTDMSNGIRFDPKSSTRKNVQSVDQVDCVTEEKSNG